MVANYRVQAELTAVESTPDGKALVLGTVDGCVSVLAIVDTEKNDTNKYLAEMPSRDEGVIILLLFLIIFTILFNFFTYFLFAYYLFTSN